LFSGRDAEHEFTVKIYLAKTQSRYRFKFSVFSAALRGI